MSTTPMKTTQSMWNDFRNCRKRCKLRTLDKLVPNQKEKCLFIGSVIHECLEAWHGEYNLNLVLTSINKTYPHKIANEVSEAGLALRYRHDEGIHRPLPDLLIQ